MTNEVKKKSIFNTTIDAENAAPCGDSATMFGALGPDISRSCHIAG
ncbi:hypothetical protein [Tardiphaga sp. 839_C3_N1_4]